MMQSEMRVTVEILSQPLARPNVRVKSAREIVFIYGNLRSVLVLEIDLCITSIIVKSFADISILFSKASNIVNLCLEFSWNFRKKCFCRQNAFGFVQRFFYLGKYN